MLNFNIYCLFCNISEYAEQFVYALKHADDDEDLKKVLGFHMVMLHKRCLDIKLAFARHVHKEGKYRPGRGELQYQSDGGIFVPFRG